MFYGLFKTFLLIWSQPIIKVNGYTFRRSNSFIFIFASHLISGQLLKKRKEFAPLFKSRPYFEWAALSRKANRKSQKLFPFIKMIENHAGELIHLIQTWV